MSGSERPPPRAIRAHIAYPTTHQLNRTLMGTCSRLIRLIASCLTSTPQGALDLINGRLVQARFSTCDPTCCVPKAGLLVTPQVCPSWRVLCDMTRAGQARYATLCGSPLRTRATRSSGQQGTGLRCHRIQIFRRWDNDSDCEVRLSLQGSLQKRRLFLLPSKSTG